MSAQRDFENIEVRGIPADKLYAERQRLIKLAKTNKAIDRLMRGCAEAVRTMDYAEHRHA